MSIPMIARPRFGNAAKLLFAIVFALVFCIAHTSSTAYAKTPRKAKYGTIRILTTPGGFPVSIDDKSYGETTSEYRPIDLDPGQHIVVVKLPSGQLWTREINLPAGRIKCISLNYKPAPVPLKSPCPYPARISAPTQVNEGEIITYSADVAYPGVTGLTYTWTVGPAGGHILSGSGTSTITVDSTELGGQRVTATLVVDDGSPDPACRQTSQAATFVSPLPKREIVGREFDECWSCSYDDQKARLDNLAVELQNDLSTSAFIIAYGGQSTQAGQANRLLARSRDYLIAQRGIDSSRITILNGGFREKDCVELWIVPRGAKSPQPTPTVQAGDVRLTKPPTANGRRRGL